MRKRPGRAKVLLVAMPWARLEHPSIQLGILHALLAARDIPSQQLHLYLDFVDYVGTLDSSLGPDAYDEVATKHLVGDWIFAVPPFKAPGDESDYLQYLVAEGATETFVATVAALRAAVPSFLERVSSQIALRRPHVVGFTTTFGQTVPSLVLALLLKQRLPTVKIILGGANCDGPMGEALFQNFPWIDVVVRGEAEPVFAEVVERLLDGAAPEVRSGLCLRASGEETVVPMAPVLQAEPTRLPFVQYDDYFARLAANRFASTLSPQVSIPFESSRGCWWGEKHHCTFCGLNGSTMTFRSFEASHVLDELVYLANRYQRLEFNAADNIMSMDLFGTLLARLAEMGCDFRLFYEVKANLRKSQVAQLRAAGVLQIQPGLESLSTAVLRRVRKGTSALQNIRLLKWCAAYGVRVHWNIIYGLPGTSSDEYLAMAEVARQCFHLDVPNLIPLSVERFSPYHAQPEQFGIVLQGPKPHYRLTYPVGEDALGEIAYAFEHRETDPRPMEPGLSRLRSVVDQWRVAQEDPGGNALRLLRGPGFAVIQDRRAGREQADYRLGRLEAQVYEACDSGATVDAICERLGSRSPHGELVREFLANLLDAGLVWREEQQYLALAVEAQPRDVDRAHARRDAGARIVPLTEMSRLAGT